MANADFETLCRQKQPENLKEHHAWQEAALKKVMACVESGGEVVDLS